jgi:hypothetical protein
MSSEAVAGKRSFSTVGAFPPLARNGSVVQIRGHALGLEVRTLGIVEKVANVDTKSVYKCQQSREFPFLSPEPRKILLQGYISYVEKQASLAVA